MLDGAAIAISTEGPTRRGRRGRIEPAPLTAHWAAFQTTDRTKMRRRTATPPPQRRQAEAKVLPNKVQPLPRAAVAQFEIADFRSLAANAVSKALARITYTTPLAVEPLLQPRRNFVQ